MSKIKNGGLDQYGTEPFEQQQFGTAGVAGLKCCFLAWLILFLCFFVPDGDMEWEEEMAYSTYSRPVEDDASDFDYLLQQAQQKLYHK